MSQSITKTSRFRILFSVCWLMLAIFHALVVRHAGYSFSLALVDSGISNALLAGAMLSVAISLQHYTPQKNLYGYLFFLCLALCILWLFSSRLFLFLTINEEGYPDFFAQTIWIRVAFGYLLISQMALTAVLWYTLQDHREVERRKSEAEKFSKEAELTSLRQQLQPHFLFNSLNSVNALIGTQPQKARTMVQQLSLFLRSTLKTDQKEWVALEDELTHLQLYLDIEKVRFGHRLNTEVQNNTTGTQLPIMLLQPIVENAIKFGLYDTIDAITISITATKENGYLVLQVENPFDPETSLPQKGTGFGLRSVQRRLTLLFSRPDLLQTERNDDLFITTIKIPQP